MKLKLISAFAVAAVAAGCQTYDFEPVIPLAIAQTTESKNLVARNLKPSLMFLIDKSGSMNFPSNSAAAGCPAGCGVSTGPCPASCPTRISELRSAMNTFLSGNGTVAWTGMAIFPTKVAPDACGATQAGDVLVQLAPNKTDVDADLNAAAMTVNTQIQSLVPGGGTPTADSLRFLGTYAPLITNPDKRQQFVLLLTDGLPNCNASNPNTCSNGTPVGGACRCTLAACTASSFCIQGCLDKDNSANAIVELAKKGIKTIVIGFGADTVSGDGPDTLNAMAEAGQFARVCPKLTDAECGTGNTCNTGTKVCNKQYYQATSATELAATLKQISDLLINGDPCVYALSSTPSDPRFLSVIVNGAIVPANDPNGWSYSAGSVTFKGTLCGQVKAATSNDPVKVEFRIVQGL